MESLYILPINEAVFKTCLDWLLRQEVEICYTPVSVL